MSIFSYTSTHGMMKKTPLSDHDDDHCHNDNDVDGKDCKTMILMIRV